ncbi:MAG: DUF1800 domain-containing protein [Janthinobacterium lividum]
MQRSFNIGLCRAFGLGSAALAFCSAALLAGCAASGKPQGLGQGRSGAAAAASMAGMTAAQAYQTYATPLGHSLPPVNQLANVARIDPVALLNRVAWGADAAGVAAMRASGPQAWLENQLHPSAVTLPQPVAAQIAAMSISQTPLVDLVRQTEERRLASEERAGDEAGKAARESFRRELDRLARESATRSLLRGLYSPAQLQERLTWFWANHFNVFQGKKEIRVLIGDYEEQAIRPFVLGRFRDLLAASLFHPAMLSYLDNERNAVNGINENYAREVMELHTLGVDGGYSQRDVQELARILTGVGVANLKVMPRVRPALQAQYVRHGLFEFNPNRHDYGDKQFLGQTVRGAGLAEVDQAITLLARQPATARFISRKLAVFLVADEPSPALVARMAKTFMQTDGDISQVLRTLFDSAEFAASLGRKFKDPQLYVMSAVRLAYAGKPITNAMPMMNWLNRMGEPLFGRQTPDGYPMTQAAWASPGQMTTRFEIARIIGSGSAGLFRIDGMPAQERQAFPQLANALFHESMQKSLSPATRAALDQAGSPQEWNTFLLSSPEMMHY